MPAQRITDLSDLLSADKLVRFRKGGPTYRLPGDIPAPLFLMIQEEAERQREAQESGTDPNEAGVGMIGMLAEQILELFQYGDPGMTELPREVTLPQMFALIARVYGPGQPAEPEGGERPSAAGTRSSTKQSRSRSRS